jgi:adenylosuccinate lyase
LSNYHTD